MNIICDIDGTLYDFKNNFESSETGIQVDTNMRNIVREHLEYSDIFFDELRASEGGFSVAVAKLLGQTRAEIIDSVWRDIQIPTSGLKGQGREFIARCIDNGIQIHFLTGAGRSWATKVLEYMQVPKELLPHLVTAEDYPSKAKEIAMVDILKSRGWSNRNTWSVGDTFDTDIQSALNLGMGVYHVTKQDKLMFFLEEMI
jgi:FMN phosphatase YigB (HAD superfamily)